MNSLLLILRIYENPLLYAEKCLGYSVRNSNSPKESPYFNYYIILPEFLSIKLIIPFNIIYIE